MCGQALEEMVLEECTAEAAAHVTRCTHQKTPTSNVLESFPRSSCACVCVCVSMCVCMCVLVGVDAYLVLSRSSCV